MSLGAPCPRGRALSFPQAHNYSQRLCSAGWAPGKSPSLGFSGWPWFQTLLGWSYRKYILDVGCWGRGQPGLHRDEAAGCGSPNLNCGLLPPQLPTNRQPRLPQRPDSEDGDLSAERRERREEEQSLSGQSLGGEHSFQAAGDRKGGTAAWSWGRGEFLAWGRGWFSPIAECICVTTISSASSVRPSEPTGPLKPGRDRGFQGLRRALSWPFRQTEQRSRVCGSHSLPCALAERKSRPGRKGPERWQQAPCSRSRALRQGLGALMSPSLTSCSPRVL